MNPSFKVPAMYEHANKLIEAYHSLLTPLSKETGLSPLALDILLFIANNPESATARDVCSMRGFKSGIVSVHVERLVVEGLLLRAADPADRRKTRLIPTDGARGIIERGLAIQAEFAVALMAGISAEELRAFSSVMDAIGKNIDAIRKGAAHAGRCGNEK